MDTERPEDMTKANTTPSVSLHPRQQSNMKEEPITPFFIIFSQGVGQMGKQSIGKKDVPEFTSARDEGVKILVNPCIRELDGLVYSICLIFPVSNGRG